MQKFHRAGRLIAVLFVLIGTDSFWYGRTHLAAKTAFEPPNCDNGYPNPPCEVVADPHPRGTARQVHVWNDWFDVPVGLGVIGLLALCNEYQPDRPLPVPKRTAKK